MPYINIKVTDEQVTKEQKRQLIEGATQLVVDVLDKSPKTTHVVIDEIPIDNWGYDAKQYSNSKKIQIMKNKTVIITGASTGIGKAVAAYFIKKESNVVMNSANEEQFKKCISTNLVLLQMQSILPVISVIKIQEKNLFDWQKKHSVP